MLKFHFQRKTARMEATKVEKANFASGGDDDGSALQSQSKDSRFPFTLCLSIFSITLLNF